MTDLRHLDIEPGPLHDLVPQVQDLRQDEHDQEHGDQRPPAQALADAHDGGLRGDPADQEPGGRQNAPGGEHRGKGQVQRLDDGLPPGHLLFQLAVPGGDDDGVIDVGAHLDGGDDQIAQEEDGFPGHAGEGEIDPDAALDHQDQQDGQTNGLEGEQQDEDDEHH